MTNDEKSRAVIRAANKAAVAIMLAAALVCTLAANSALAAPQAAPTPKILRFHGIVVTANLATIIVRNPKNPREQIGFSYSPAVRDQMVKILTAGGFQYGDKVSVDYATGTTVAMRLHGKPSKPKKQPPPQQTQP